jgi:hypothetical protein
VLYEPPKYPWEGLVLCFELVLRDVWEQEETVPILVWLVFY